MNIELRAKADIPGLRRSLRCISHLSRRLIYSQRFAADDHLGFMTLAFLSKLVEQARSVRILIRRKAGRDAELVSRSMLEAMTSLLWAARDPDDRAFKWRGYSYIEDFRLMGEQKAEGIVIDPATEKTILDFLSKHGSLFEDPRRVGKADPYHRNWRCGVKIRDVFNEVGALDLYEQIYGPSSDWIHTGTASVGGAIKRRGTSVVWSQPPKSMIARSLATAFQSIAESMKLSVEHFGSDLEAPLKNLVREFTTRFDSAP